MQANEQQSGFSAKVLCDSISESGCRLTTMEWTFPRCILAEVNTHRMLSRNAASSRAIPTERLIQRVLDSPFIPEFRLNQKGMQAGDALGADDSEAARSAWLNARDEAVARARQMHGLNIHKQYVNRLLEPWMFCTIIVSATDWENVWHLRCSPEAEPSFRKIAEMARDAMNASVPKLLAPGMWHLPLVSDEDAEEVFSWEVGSWDKLKAVSVGRCARVSYLTHDGKRDLQADIDLCDRLAKSGHWSPFEHVATPSPDNSYCGNFSGWIQYRKSFDMENIKSR